MKRLVLLLTLLATAVCSAACDPEIGGQGGEGQAAREPVIFIQGGTIDDSVSYLLLTTMEGIDLQGILVTHTDTIADQAMQVQWKMMQLTGHSGVPVALSDARGWNPFPWLYRSDIIRHHNIEAFSKLEDNEDWPPHPAGDDLLYDALSQAIEQDSPVTLLITCPLTPLSDLLREHSDLKKGIARLVWMGGAIHVPGNLDPTTVPPEIANPGAEWNAFWDPPAVDWVFRNTSFPIVMFPLDITDQAPITDEFWEGLERQAASHLYSDLVRQSYALIRDEPFYEMWNTTTTAYLAHPEFFEAPETMELEIETLGFDQGTIRQSSGGRKVDVVLDFAQKNALYAYLLQQFRRSHAHSEVSKGVGE
jgi:purine nucleosidase